MKPQSAKNKGREGQKEIVDLELKILQGILEPGDLMSRPMGSPGEDIMASPKSLTVLPLAQEVKHGKTYKQLYGLYAKAGTHKEAMKKVYKKDLTPVTHVRLTAPKGQPKNKWLSIIATEDLINLYKEIFRLQNEH